MSIKEGYLKKWSASFLAFGEPFHRVPCNPTSLTASEIPLAFGVLYGPHMGTQMAWFACPDQATLSSWTNALTSLFQQTSTLPSAPPPYQPSPAPALPTGSIGFGKTMDPGFVLLGTRRQGVPVILRELVLFSGFDLVSPSFTVRDVITVSMPDPSAYGGNPGGYGPPPPISQPNYGYPTNNYVPPTVPPAPGAYVPGTSSYSGNQPRPQDPQSQYFVGQNGQPYQVVYIDGKPKKKKCKGLKNAAVGRLDLFLFVIQIHFM
ncbi:unnamed protein product [Schistosoma margrebowiei]|uniref:Uncharacterized protein n=1 Tax=Schistosoma margrebowiei TaxID=48269 RepID=A0A183MTG2_9TREM|nr:unnamed protein product [Schistosoma margrebowiei]